MKRILSAIVSGIISLGINSAMACGIAWVLPLGGLEYWVRLVVIIFLYGVLQLALFDPIASAIKGYRRP